jgi:hypothetical protein
VAVRVLHMFRCRRNDYAPSAVPESNSRLRCRCCFSVVRARSVRRRPLGQTPTGLHGTNAQFWPGLQRLHGPLNDAQLDWLGYRLMLLNKQLSGERRVYSAGRIE